MRLRQRIARPSTVRLSEAAWAEAAVATGFIQKEPDPGVPATEHTEVRVLFDGAALYVGFTCFVRDPATIVARLARRDALVTSDWALVEIDSRLDERTAFSFAISAAGVKRDVLLYDDIEEDQNWDAVWDAATRRTPEGWTAEFRIPLSQLRFRSGDGLQQWGIQFQRSIPANGEESFWAPINPDEDRYVSRFGRLTGLSGLRAPNGLEVQPYVASRLTREPGETADPFYAPNDLGASAGADIKYGLTSGLTLSATINPDFGQVEADPARVNLSAFEDFFEERRPFFLEGTNIFRYGGTRSYRSRHNPTFFYSRRIGRRPQRSIFGEDVIYADAPDQTTIAAAAKLSGRIGNWSVGVLDAVTTQEVGRYFSTDGQREELLVEPLTNYAVARVQQQGNNGRTVAGGLITLVHRDMGDVGFAPLLHRNAVVAGVDFEHAWADRAWTVSGVLAGSQVAGEASRIAATQRSSRRYLQRPDADHLTYDPDRTALAGSFAEVSLARTSGEHWTGSVTGAAVSPGFEVNDLGFQTRADARSLSAQVNYFEAKPGWKPLRNYRIYAFTIQSWNGGGDRFDAFYALDGRANFRNLWSVSGRVFVQPETFDDRLTRGGPIARAPATQNGYIQLYTDGRRAVSGSLFLLGRRDDSGRFERTVEAGVTFRPSAAVEVSLEPGYTRTFRTDQFITSYDPSAGNAPSSEPCPDTFGRCYLFADIEQREFALTTRLNWTFTPDLTLQLYARPFIAAGQYSGYKRFTEPGTFDFDAYPEGESPVERRDFDDFILQGNAVVRWEYRPGSTLFFVWQQERFGFESEGDFDLGRGLRGIADGAVYNVFLVKATYWLGL